MVAVGTKTRAGLGSVTDDELLEELSRRRAGRGEFDCPAWCTVTAEEHQAQLLDPLLGCLEHKQELRQGYDDQQITVSWMVAPDEHPSFGESVVIHVQIDAGEGLSPAITRRLGEDLIRAAELAENP